MCRLQRANGNSSAVSKRGFRCGIRNFNNADFLVLQLLCLFNAKLLAFTLLNIRVFSPLTTINRLYNYCFFFNVNNVFDNYFNFDYYNFLNDSFDQNVHWPLNDNSQDQFKAKVQNLILSLANDLAIKLSI